MFVDKKYAKNQWVTTNYIPNYEEGHIGGSPALDFKVILAIWCMETMKVLVAADIE